MLSLYAFHYCRIVGTFNHSDDMMLFSYFFKFQDGEQIKIRLVSIYNVIKDWNPVARAVVDFVVDTKTWDPE